MSAIRLQRLVNQQLIQPAFKTPTEVVRWMGAIQAQDYLGALWAVGMRLPAATEQEVERAIETRKIVRTWPMRGTIHFVPAEDAGWMVKLMAGRVVSRVQSIYRRLDLDEQIFAHSHDVVRRALQGGRLCTRKDLYGELQAAGIDTGNGRGLQIIGHLAFLGLICFGPRRGKQPTFTLLDEWVPQANKLEGEAALGEIALRYFRSHGPATIQDFTWWSGLLVKEAQVGLEIARQQLVEETIAGTSYWRSEAVPDVPVHSPALFLLPPFDEYLVSYKDRSASLDARYPEMNKAENHLRSTIVVDGRVVGNWKRTIKKGTVSVETKLAKELTEAERKRFDERLGCYADFLGLKVE